MQGDDPPYLPVGTDVSAKYKGAFCEAKVKKVVRNIKCKVTLKAGGSITVNDDVIKGTLRIGSNVEVKQDPKKDAIEAIITKIQDCSQYTVVFDDGDITTLRRSALCLKSGRHFNESETLDQLPLTHPEHFSTPVIAGRRGRRGRAQSEDSDGEGPSRPIKRDSAEREPHVGRVVLVEAASGAERRRPHQPAFPALVVAPTAQIKVKEDYLVRSFKDGRYYTVPKKEAREFRKGSAPLEWAGVEAALQYLNNGVLPPHWDRDSLFNEPRNTSDDSSDDEPREEKDHFVAQLYKFMDDRGTPLNRNPTIANRDIDLYRLFRVVQKLGGYNRVTNQNQWKSIADKMGFHPVTTSITNLCKQAYKKFLHSFEDFYRKLGVTLVAHPRGARTPPAGRSLIRDRDKQPPTSSSACSTPTGPPSLRGKDKDSDKSETDRSEKDDKSEKGDRKEKPQISDEEDSADNQPLIVNAPKLLDKEKEKEKEREKEKEKEREKEKEKEKEREKEKEKEKEREKEKEKEKEKDSHKEREKSTSTRTSEEKVLLSKPRPRSRSKPRTVVPARSEQTPKRRPLSSKSESTGPTSVARASRRHHVSTDSDSSVSGRVSRCGPLTKKMQSRRSQSANSASSGNTIASNSSKPPRKRKTTEPSTNEPTPPRIVSGVKAQVGDKLKVYYGPTQSESKVLRKIEKPGRKLARPLPSSRTSQVTYEAKVTEISAEGMLRVHYTGWNTRYDEWIKPQRIAVNVSQHEARNKKGSSMSRRVRAKRTEESSAISDSDTSDSDEDIKRPPKKLDDKSNASTPGSKDTKSSDSSSSSKPRKRPLRNISTPTNISPAKKLRPNAPSHQGRDYDLNEIRSELKGFNTVKQEPEEIKQEPTDKDTVIGPAQISISSTEPPQPEKGKEEDVYEFKEPEPFELELHDEKKKRTHRIFDDISPSKYTSALSKSLSEEINEDPMKLRTSSLRSPSLSPYRDCAGASGIGKHSPEDDCKDELFSLDDDSFHGDGSSGPTFEGFTPAKNQETYSKKSKVSKLRQLIDDSPDSPADDEQSSDESEDITMKEDDDDVEGSKSVSPTTGSTEESKSSTSSVQDEPKAMDEDESEITEEKPNEKPTIMVDLQNIPKPPNSPPPLQNIDIPIKIEISKKIENPIKIDHLKKPEAPKKSEPPKKIETPNKIELTKKTEFSKKIELPKKIETSKKIEPIKKGELTKKTELPKKSDLLLPKKIDILKKVEPFKKIEFTKRTETLKKLDVVKKTEPPKKIEILEKVEITKKIEIRKIEHPPTTIILPVLASTSILTEAKEKTQDEMKKENQIKLLSIPLPSSEPKERPIKDTPIKMDPESFKTKLEPPSSPLIDPEEDKSEPDSPARIDVIPEPPPGFLLQSEGPKIAEKLLKAISSAKRLSMSPPPVDNRASPVTPKADSVKPAQPESKLSPISPEPKTSIVKTDPVKPTVKAPEPTKKDDSIFGEPSNIMDSLDVKKKEGTSTPRLQSPLNILERRKSVATDLPLSVVAGKNNKVLSDTIQKLSSQINQTAAINQSVTSVANIPLPASSIPFLSEDRSESSDSDDSSRRLIIDKLSMEEWGSGASSEATRAAPSAAGNGGLRALHLGKSPGEWSAGESLLMLEDACKNERKHSASVVVAGSGRVAATASTSIAPAASQPAAAPAAAPAPQEEDSNISLLLCEETIPGSPAPDAEPAPPRQRPHMPFASAPPHHLAKDDRRGEGPSRAPGPAAGAGAAGERAAGWGRGRLLVDNTPPTTPDSNRSSLDMSPQRERRMSERDSPLERKEEEDENSRPNDASVDMDKSVPGSRSRKASESSAAGAGRGRRRARRDTDEHGSLNSNSTATLKYNFYVELDPTWDCQTRINVLTTRLADLRKTYHSVKAELAAIDRRRKKLRRKEREAVKAAKAACA